MYWHLTQDPYQPKNLSCQKSQFMQTSDHSQQCFIAQQYCQHDFLYLNYSILSYCWLNGSIMTTLIVSGFVGYLVYNGISEVIKEYLIPSLEAVKVRFEISEIMAGVTLLAFGNGAGDVLTALVASSYPGGIDYNIGATMGAGFVNQEQKLYCLVLVQYRSIFDYQDIQILNQDGSCPFLEKCWISNYFYICYNGIWSDRSDFLFFQYLTYSFVFDFGFFGLLLRKRQNIKKQKRQFRRESLDCQ